MSAAEALTVARAAGIQVRIDGDDLALEASAPPSAEVLDLLARHKAAILHELREVANNPSPSVRATRPSQEMFEFAPPGDSANDSEALAERVAIMMESNGWDDATALQEAHWQADRERCWQVFLRNAQRVLEAPAHEREGLLARYQVEATSRYGEQTGTNMASGLRSWLKAGAVH
jgi:hypothetical protein